MNKNGFEDRSEDRRVRKSKKALEEALIRLLAKRPSPRSPSPS